MQEIKATYPVIPIKHWWAIRNRLKQTMPSTIYSSLIGAILGMKDESAKSNILPGLLECGLIDAKGKPTELANRWRDDTHYADACKEIRTKVYPQELIDAVPGPEPSLETAARWFTNKLRVGRAAALRFAGVYILVTQANVAKAPSKKIAPSKQANKENIKPTKTKTISKIKEPINHDSSQNYPSIHINLQIHISPEASPEQIEKIFSSIDKYIYKKRN